MATNPRKLFAVLALCGLVGYFVCLARHWCQCGHMEHPPYAWADYVLDVSWVTLFTAAGVVSIFRLGESGVMWFLLLGGMTASRFLLPQTMGLSVFGFELPASVAILVRCVWLLVSDYRDKRPIGIAGDDRAE